MLWRAKTIICRNKIGALLSLHLIIIYTTFVIVYALINTKREIDIKAQDYVTITSSGNLTNGSNLFAESGIQTNFTLPNCQSKENTDSAIAYI